MEEVEKMPDIKPIGCRWVFNIKYNSDGSLERYKSRLDAKGYTQSYRIDYTYTFAPVEKLNIIRILISFAVNLNWELHQYDIKNAFLNGELEEEIYMQIHQGYENHTIKGKLCTLKRALYGLKQSPRAWFWKFTKIMELLEYRQCNGDHTLFFLHSPAWGVTILIVYVDDIFITRNNTAEANS